ncbi:MAG: 3-deoxy-manno-octulosonate-8-phosphatase KdsC [Desulfuromonadales bacterium]|nr:3-deoxy-manno-octulosonate-8-phosphatase KdsC [Desulfuromonadales bacterium]NIR33038.1 3-deoxy-manno-octulosonate-8-phosphatase KdsC [Desulfuromonadales bacterium]NIS43057.1 3-deoxy-manno-octulosonate-8-phosphatase KdsC [Desulfuromonadales bacterium]
MRTELEKIRLLLLDVDGVMTDGRIIYDNNGVESKAFDVKDGHGLKLLQRSGIQVGIITGRRSQVVEKRAEELQIEILYQGAKDKLIPFREILDRQELSPSEVAYVGDDLVDLPILRQVGFAATVADAVEDVKPFVHYVCRNRGGRGAVREICDLLLKKTGRWESVTGRYF